MASVAWRAVHYARSMVASAVERPWSTAKALPERVREHNLTLVAAGVAFYAFLAFVPTLIAVVSIYGLVAEPADVARQVGDFASALPDEVQSFIEFQLTSIAESKSAGVSLTLVIALALALWSASGGMAALITGIHVAYEQNEPKSFVAKRGKALYLTLGAVVLLGMIVFLVAALPSLVDGLGSAGRVTLGVLRWPILAVVMIVGLGLLYRLAVPNRGQAGSASSPPARSWRHCSGSWCRACSRSTPRTLRATARHTARSPRSSWCSSGCFSVRWPS